jgi:hypothetical protein
LTEGAKSCCARAKAPMSDCASTAKKSKKSDEVPVILVRCPCGAESGSAHFHAQDPRLLCKTVQLARSITSEWFTPFNTSRIVNPSFDPQTPPPRDVCFA